MRSKLCILRKPSRAAVDYVPAIRMEYDSKANVYRERLTPRVIPTDQLPLGVPVLKISGVHFEGKHKRNMNLIMYNGLFYSISSGWLRALENSESKNEN